MEEAPAADEEDEDMAPAVAEENNIAAAPEEKQAPAAENDMQEDVLMSQVRNYTLKDGMTLEQKVFTAHPDLDGDIDWSLAPTEEQNVYSVAIKLPTNSEGQSYSYRFNYNTDTGILTPTTSEAKNIMTA